MSFIRKRESLNFAILLICMSQLPFSSGIRCYECGKLDMIPSTSDFGCDPITTFTKTCRYDLSSENSSSSSANSFLNNLIGPSSSLLSDELTDVCYRLSGTFRGEYLLMGGCDAMPMDKLDIRWEYDNPEDPEQPNPNTTWKCMGEGFKAWFETELGREDIAGVSLCICDTDFCNFERRGEGGGPIQKSVLGLYMFSILLVVISGYHLK